MKRKRGETRRRKGAGRERSSLDALLPSGHPQAADRRRQPVSHRDGTARRRSPSYACHPRPPPPAPGGGAAPARPRPPPPRGPAGPRLTRAVQEEPEQQGCAEGRVCSPHPAPTGAHGCAPFTGSGAPPARKASGQRWQGRAGHGQRPEAGPGRPSPAGEAPLGCWARSTPQRGPELSPELGV